MTERQKTVKESVSISGVGLHTGKTVNLTFRPSEENSGIRFLRTDIGENAFIQANTDNVIETSRGTTLEEKGSRISTVEHVLAAVSGFEIDNLIIEVDSLEIPILDGSSKLFTQALKKASIKKQNAIRETFEITEPIRFFDENKKSEYLALPSDRLRFSCLIDFNTKVLNKQHASLDEISNFEKEIAPSRTFVFLHELEYLANNNLIKGGNLSNAIVFVDQKPPQEKLDKMASLFNMPTIEVKEEGILNNIDLYHDNEPARHKLLDVIGDLALVGKPLKAQIIANKPGHASNIEFAKKIKSYIKNKKNMNTPKYDPNTKPVYDVNDIKRMLPHRYPFLLVDKIIEVTDNHVIGIKNVTMNENFFQGHFPEEPIMPGVLQIEAMAQTGGIFNLSKVDDPGNYNTYFLKIDKVRFKKKVVPGDTLIFKLELLSPVRRGICHMKGTAYVGNEIVAEAELMAQIAKKQ